MKGLCEFYTCPHAAIGIFMDRCLIDLSSTPSRRVSYSTAGQHSDSTKWQVKVMKKKTYLLNRLLSGLVHRKGFEVLARDLHPKQEFVILVRLSRVQRAIYEEYLALRAKAEMNSTRGKGLFHAFQTLIQVWNHPYVLEMGSNGSLGLDEGCIGDCTAVDPAERGDKVAEMCGAGLKESDSKRDDDAAAIAQHFSRTWWRNAYIRIMPANSSIPEMESDPKSSSSEKRVENLRDMSHSGKIVILLEILREAIDRKEKTLVFTQSIGTLNLIEEHLASCGVNIKDRCKARCSGETYGWVRGREFFRIDGSTSSVHRQQWVKCFNKSSSAHLFMLSTRAGSLGINLVGANRVVILDACWNPSYDLQAVFRAYRYGQTKPVTVYRLITKGTMVSLLEASVMASSSQPGAVVLIP